MKQNSVGKEEFLKLNFFQKIWYSITKFERYPEMAALGVKKALIYFTELMAVFSILFTLIFVYYASNVAEFEDENLTVSQKILQTLANDAEAQGQDIGLQEMIDSVAADTPETVVITSLFLGNFISYYLITLIDVFTLSVFGLLTCWIARIKMNYKAVFNMSIFALTLSIILRLIYLGLNLLLGFEIKNFSIMYIAVSYISLAAAIFLIKSDVIKQQLELMRIIEESKDKIEQTITIPKRPKEDEKDKDEDEDEKKQEKKRQKENQGQTRRRRVKCINKEVLKGRILK